MCKLRPHCLRVLLCVAVLGVVTTSDHLVNGQQNNAPSGGATSQSPAEKNGTPAQKKLKRPSWPEVEVILQKSRDDRKPGSPLMTRLIKDYEAVAEPSFSGSESIDEHCAALKKWRDELPDSSTALVVLAKARIAHAWEARGEGLADTVTEEGWRLFNARIEEARTLLEKAIQMKVKDGEAYALLITVAKAQGLQSRASEGLAR